MRNLWIGEDDPGPRISLGVFRALALSRQIPSLCPNLRSLDWNGDHEFLQYVGAFLAPTLSHVSLDLTGADLAELSFILSLQVTHPHMKSITFIDYDNEAPDSCIYRITSNSISDLVCKWNYLESFTCGIAINAQALRHLATLSTLQKLDLRKWDPGDDIQISIAGKQHPIAFSALIDLTFRNHNISTWTALLDNMTFNQLKRIQVSNVAPGETAALERFLYVLHARCSHSSLNCVKMKQNNISGPHNPLDHGTVETGMLKRLLSFQQLERLEICTTHSYNFGNEMLRDMTVAWPRLQCLMLGMYGWARQGR